jgi:hypothetical protein
MTERTTKRILRTALLCAAGIAIGYCLQKCIGCSTGPGTTYQINIYVDANQIKPVVNLNLAVAEGAVAPGAITMIFRQDPNQPLVSVNVAPVTTINGHFIGAEKDPNA